MLAREDKENREDREEGRQCGQKLEKRWCREEGEGRRKWV